MDTTTASMPALFAQLGLPDDDASMRDFVRRHRPLPMTTRLYDAPFWTPAQAALIREKLQDDSDWAVQVDTLNAQLREHPAPG